MPIRRWMSVWICPPTFGCPFEGMKSEDDVVPFLKPYVDSGIRTVNLCDTIGIANPAQVRRIIEAVRAEYPSLDLQVHIHDTRNMGMVNTLAAIELWRRQSAIDPGRPGWLSLCTRGIRKPGYRRPGVHAVGNGIRARCRYPEDDRTRQIPGLSNTDRTVQRASIQNPGHQLAARSQSRTEKRIWQTQKRLI